MTAHFGSKKINQVYLGTQNTNCLTSVPKNVNLVLDPLNVNIVGSPTINNGVVSGFSGSNWLRLPTIFNPGSNAWEMVIKVRTPSAFSKRNWLTGGGNAAGKDFDFVSIGLESNGKPLMYITSNGTSWNIASAAISSNTLEVNTDYLFRFQFTGTQYIYSTSVDNGSNWITQVTINSTTSIFVPTTPQAIGTTCYTANAPEFWSGSIDLPNSYIKINGSTWWKGGTGILTLKAGSKVYVPNGKNADGSLKFDEFITSNDIVDRDFGNASKEVAFLITKGGSANNFSVWGGSLIVSGTSAPDFSAFGYWGIWYDTANNIIKIQNGTNEWKAEYGFSLPFCLVSSSDSAVTSVDQIFDWCGYIGSTAFVLPGVKGLIPNGFNADGTYKSIEFTTDRVLTTTRTWDVAASFVQRLFITNRGKEVFIQNYQVESNSMPTVNDFAVWYSPKENIQRWNGSSNTLTDISQWTIDSSIRYVGEIPSDGTSKITSLTPATVQPLRTGRKINYIYKGSQMVYGVFKTKTFYPSSELQQFTVPNGVTKLHIDCVASQGNNGNARGGYGGRVQCDLNVTSGEVLYFTVGDIPSSPTSPSYNASDIRIGGTAYSNRVIVAGGGGSGSYGNASNGNANGGAGGGTTGGQGANTPYNVGGFGGTQTSGGARGYATDTGGTTGGGYGNDGGYPLGGNGISGPGNYNYTYSGAGGAGLYGGGSGGTYEYFGTRMAGGGGGSSYTNSSLCSNVVHTQGYRNGSGYITISLA